MHRRTGGSKKRKQTARLALMVTRRAPGATPKWPAGTA